MTVCSAAEPKDIGGAGFGGGPGKAEPDIGTVAGWATRCGARGGGEAGDGRMPG